jgi:hypothetical protein
MQMDLLTVGVGFVSFGIFFIIHVITFRWLRPEVLLKSLRLCMLAIAVLPLMLMGILFVNKAADVSLPAWILASLLALAVAGLVSLFYVLCVFGPYETSVRMRIVRELDRRGPEGLSLQELLGRYSPETILNIRLRRLMGSGDVIEKNGLYHSGSKRNFLFFSDLIAGMIKKWIG